MELKVARIFDTIPLQWGLRGDPFLWEVLKNEFESIPLPYSLSQFFSDFKKIFERITGQHFDDVVDSVYVENFAHGGLSGGMVSAEFYRRTAIPLLQDRLKIYNQWSQHSENTFKTKFIHIAKELNELMPEWTSQSHEREDTYVTEINQLIGLFLTEKYDAAIQSGARAFKLYEKQSKYFRGEYYAKSLGFMNYILEDIIQNSRVSQETIAYAENLKKSVDYFAGLLNIE